MMAKSTSKSYRISSRALGAALVAALVVSCLLTYTATAQQGGTDWSDPVDVTRASSAQAGAFGLVLCDQYQNAHLLFSDISDNAAEIYYATDKEGRWSTPIDILAVPHLAIRLSAHIEEDILYLYWEDMHIGGDTFVSYAPLADADTARSWAKPRVSEFGVPFFDQNHVMHTLQESSSEDSLSKALYYMRSDDEGKTWSVPSEIFAQSYAVPTSMSARLAVDAAGRVHVGITVRSQEYGEVSEVGYMRSDIGAQSWDPYRVISAMGTTWQGVSTIVPYTFGENEIHLTWHDPRRMHQWSLDGGLTWSQPEEIMPLGAAFGGENELVKDSAGDLYVILATGGGVYAVGNHGNQWDTPENIDHRFIDPHGQHITVCQGNQLHVVYYDRLGDTKVWYSTRNTGAPHLPRKAIPTPPPESSPAPLHAVPATPQVEASSERQHGIPLDKGPTQLSPLPPVAWGTTAALLLILLSAAGAILARR